ncbi:hypothetical protein J2S73_001057 [Amorphus orientalis]|uniref:Uncharacterized protein n=1 Tax=Amorphus orientalis TaxID=649198 RepID=A0AAE3VMS8_9HYPH|nr:hypothetical protein [Amorphus orientalis]
MARQGRRTREVGLFPVRCKAGVRSASPPAANPAVGGGHRRNGPCFLPRYTRSRVDRVPLPAILHALRQRFGLTGREPFIARRSPGPAVIRTPTAPAVGASGIEQRFRRTGRQDDVCSDQDRREAVQGRGRRRDRS